MNVSSMFPIVVDLPDVIYIYYETNNFQYNKSHTKNNAILLVRNRGDASEASMC